MKTVFISYFLGTAYLILGLVSWIHLFSPHNWWTFVIDFIIALFGTPYGFFKERLKDCLSSTLYKFPLPDDEKYPIEFENGMGKWSIEKDGTASFQPIIPVQRHKH